MDELKSCENINEKDLVVGDWIGGGCSSVVFKGEWNNDGKILEVAIKQIRLNGEEAVIEVCRELKTMQSLPLDNICKLYGWCVIEAKKQVWLVMEFAQEGDLHSFLRRHGPLPKDLQLSFCIQVTQALASLHNAPSPILHRDIKSLNYLVQPNNKLILTDFGLSKAKALTTAETFTVGTVRWVAPEVVLTDKRQWSEKADIYSLGMVYCEILTGEFPYSEESDLHINRILDKIKHKVLPKLPDECPKGLAEIIQRCLRFKPEKRPNINELLDLWAKVDLADSSPRKGDKRKSKEKAVPPLAPTPPLTNSGKKKIPPPISPPTPTSGSAEHELTPIEAPLQPFSPRSRHQRAQSEVPARSMTPSLLSRQHKDKRPAYNYSLNEKIPIISDLHEPQNLFASKRAASHAINTLMKKIQEKGRILQEIKAQMDAMVAQAGGATLELEQSDAYKDLYARYSSLQEEVREAKATLTTLSEKLWGKVTFETPTSPTLHRKRSYSLNNVSQPPQQRNSIARQFRSFKARLSGSFSRKKEKAQSSDESLASYTSGGSGSYTEADTPAIKHQVDPELLKQIIEHRYKYQENAQRDDTATRREGETMREQQREVNSEERHGRPRLGSAGKRPI